MASLKKADGFPERNPHPFRTFSPSSEPPKSVFQLEMEERQLLALLQAISAHDLPLTGGILLACTDIDFTFSEIRPLVFASSLGQLDTVELFAARGANLGAAGKLPTFILENVVCYNEYDISRTPLEVAELHGHDDLAGFLRKRLENKK